jgi:PIN domain nuclease of toxin-antitoxin system
LKVDLVASNKVVDAEQVLATNVREEAANQAEVAVPAPSISDVDVSEDAAVDEFMVMEDEVSDEVADAGTDEDLALVANESGMPAQLGDDTDTDTEEEKEVA